MKRYYNFAVLLGVLVLAVVCFVAFTVPAAAEGPTVVMDPSPVLKLDKKTKVTIMGSGFEPGQEIRLVVTQSDGSLSDIADGLEPEPKANEFGVWATAWTVGSFSHKRIAKPGAQVLQVCDPEYNVIATVPFGYYDAKKPYKDWPAWAQAVVKEPKPKGEKKK